MNNTVILKAPYTHYPNTVRYFYWDDSNDFGAKWYGLPCDDSYWNAIRPIFTRLQSLKEEKVAWHDMTDKEDSVYLPIVDAFIKEMDRAYKADSTIPARLISYLLGIRDFYKVVAIDKKQLTEFSPSISVVS